MLSWLGQLVLSFLFAQLEKAAQKEFTKIVEDQKQGKVDDTNIKTYQAAKERSDKVKAALDVLNGTSSK